YTTGATYGRIHVLATGDDGDRHWSADAPSQRADFGRSTATPWCRHARWFGPVEGLPVGLVRRRSGRRLLLSGSYRSNRAFTIEVIRLAGRVRASNRGQAAD